MEEDVFVDDPSLVPPDVEAPVKFNWDDDFQRSIIALLASDRQFLMQSIDLLKPSYFKHKTHSEMCKFLFDYFNQYRVPPNYNFVMQHLKGVFQEQSNALDLLTEAKVVYDHYHPGLDSREYLQDKIVFFAKMQSLKESFKQSLNLMDKDPESEKTWSKIYDLMRNAMQTHQNFDIGVDYLKTFQDRYIEKENAPQNQNMFVFGLPSLDTQIANGGYGPGEIVSVVAGSGVGKSVLLACMTATNVLRGKKVLYITLEISESKIADRLDAILTGFPVQNLLLYKDDIFEKLSNLENVKYEGDIYPLVIKQFPAGTATVNTIRAYISQLKMYGFSPEMVVIDYVGEMKLNPSIDRHEAREEIVRDLRGMATEEGLFIATAMQPNRDGKKDSKNERGRIDDDHLAGSFGQIRPLDGCISLNQNDNEKQLGIGRGYVIKQRDGKSRFEFYLRFDPQCLRITEITLDEYKMMLNSHKEYASTQTGIDLSKVKTNWKPAPVQETTPEITNKIQKIMQEEGAGWDSFLEASQSDDE